MLRSIDFHGLKAVEFSKGDYTALLIPEMGANLVRLANTRLGVEILRTPGPGEIATFRGRPHVFGLPILFPPNRIADGRYLFEGRTYQYPITIERERNYHHGILKSEAFMVSKARETDREVMVECRYYSNAGNDAVFRHFPHEFKCKIVYRLMAEGLEQEVVFSNRSKTRMPLGVGFHTPLVIPFAGGGDADYVMRLAVGEEIELGDRNLPTGRRLPLSERFAKLRREGLRVTGCEPIEAGFTLREIDVDGKSFRGALVEHRPSGVRTFYEVDGQTTCWTLWNNGGQVPYCCPEPQTWTTNAPNAADPAAEGFQSIAPGESWHALFRLYAR
ncbi:aldose 1-epimerase [Alistipes sp.]|uniref:aldose 1-epimerase n=1 Tax=Alistipes sp. TaxID=1872444 RepID=UPI0025C15693|nr:aldose 1-epimerase [Alistipes sp.]